MFTRLIKPLLPRSQPWSTRQSYSHELITALTFPAAVAMVEGGVIGVLARKAFDVPPLLFATILAIPVFANLTSFVWARLARGRRKVSFINTMQYGVLIAIAAIALLPTTPAGGLMLAGIILVIRCLLAGAVTLRSTVWRHNYPRAVRATVTGRLTLVQSLVMSIAPVAGFALLDHTPAAFPVVYIGSALLAGIGTVAFGRVRLRGERDLLRFECSQSARPQPKGETGSIYEYDPESNATFWTVLRQDRSYRDYMALQFLAGLSNLAGETMVVFIIADMTQGMNREYVVSILLTTALPMTLATATLPYWGRKLDCTHVARFRADQSWIWIMDQFSNWVGAWLGSLWVIAAARLLQGSARGAGMLAWNLGHNDFASRRMVALYMGIHVTLTGVRGAIAPFLGVLLLAGSSGRTIPLLDWPLPSVSGLGPHAFLVTTVGMIGANFGFTRLARRLESQATKTPSGKGGDGRPGGQP